jgi:flagellar export protein FliJ
MGFRFSLAALLRLRQSVERQQAERLQETSGAVARAHETLATMDRALADQAQWDESSLRQGRCAAELQFSLHARAAMRAKRDSFQVEVQRLEFARQAAALEYGRAYREREVLESLSTQQRHAYQQDQLQREQRELDASHLLQLWRKRLG